MRGLLKYFSLEGRANRQRFWLTALSIAGLGFVGGLLAVVLTVIPFLGLVILPIGVALIVATVANAARRLHDRGKSAWWLLLFYFLPLLLSLPAELARFSPSEGFQLAAAALALLGLPFSIWALVELGFLKGTAGRNKYGDDPLVRPMQEALA